MRRILLFFLLMPAVGTSAAAPVDLVIVAGQSNAVGYDTRPVALPADAGDKEILFWWRCGDPPPDEFDSVGRGWTHLQPQPRGQPNPDTTRPRQYGNFADASGGFGPEIGLARTLRAREGGRLAVIKVAFSGTGMRTDWDPASSGEAGACFRALVAECRSANASAKGKGIELRPRALAWVQGESDANAVDAPIYAERLGAMIGALRKELGAPGLVACLGVNTRFAEGKNQFMPVIVEQQRRLAGMDSRCVYVDTSVASIANPYHFDSAGTLEVGKRFADALLGFERKIQVRAPAGR